MTRVRAYDIWVPVNADATALDKAVARKLGASSPELGQVSIVQRALDARHRPPRYVYTIDLEVPAALANRLIKARKVEPTKPSARHRYVLEKRPDGPPPLVIGAGPAGLFAALTLCAAGWPPLVIERGRSVPARARDVSRLYSKGELDLDSNVCFGEGGAGTFSDGKLYTRVGDALVRRVLELLVEHGAPPSILIDNRPHLGTDRLVALLETVRAHLLAMGADMRFETAVEDFELENQALTAIRLRSGDRVEARAAVLATGHSARDIWQRLAALGLPLEGRPFAVGFRVEHPQVLIDTVRYGVDSESLQLPAADYRVTHNEDGRGVYSFCMCPGGVVVTTPTRPEELCINGMSHAARSGRYANSALVVTVGPEDFAAQGHTGVFAGAAFQEVVERAAYKAGGGAFVAPAARLTDFVEGRVSSDLPATSYRRGLTPADLGVLYPQPVTDALKRAIRSFDRKLRGFLTDEAKLIGVETRTASPIRVPRDEGMQAVGARGLFPAGEGMGYGGGIVSAAVDGIRSAEALLESVGARREDLAESLGS